MERRPDMGRMEDQAFVVQPFAFSKQIAGVLVERLEVRSDFAKVVAMRGEVKTVVPESVEFLLERRMVSHQVAVRGREGLRHHILLWHVDHVTRSDTAPPFSAERITVVASNGDFAVPVSPIRSLP